MAVISVINIHKNQKKAELNYFLDYFFNNICLNIRGNLFSFYESFLSLKNNKLRSIYNAQKGFRVSMLNQL